MSGYELLITPSAFADISVSKDYYNSRSEGLGERMAKEVDQVLTSIIANPQSYSLRYKQIRAAKIASFPYLVFYKVDEKNKVVQILRVFNTHQNPFWR